MDISLRFSVTEEKAALTAFIATAFAAAFHHRAAGQSVGLASSGSSLGQSG